MVSVSSCLLSLYFSSLIAFSFVSHPVIYCVLLLSSALSAAGFIYSSGAVAWYIALFCLVYVGGVYVLFIFVSVHNPNPSPLVSSGFIGVAIGFFFFCSLFSCLPVSVLEVSENSFYLCSFFEGVSYCFFCLVLMLGFACISVIGGDKDSFFR